MSALSGFLQAHANGCDFYESSFTDYCTCGRFEARQEYKMLLARIAELEEERTKIIDINTEFLKKQLARLNEIQTTLDSIHIPKPPEEK